MTQTSFWQTNKQSNDFAEICNALYERELRLLAHLEKADLHLLQARLQSLSHYIKRTANAMLLRHEQANSPLLLDIQNATWSSKQASKIPLAGQANSDILSWYAERLTVSKNSLLGLVVPVFVNDHIMLDCIDGIDVENNRIRTNSGGWFLLKAQSDKIDNPAQPRRLLKPNKKVMLAACAGHRWQAEHSKTKVQPIIPSLRELLLSCTINWQNFKQPSAL